MKIRIVLAMIVLSLVWGSTWMAIRVLVLQVPPMHSAAVRFLLASAILLPLIQIKKLPWPTGRGLRATLVLSLTMIAVPSALTFWSEQRLSSGLTALIFGAMPLMTAILTPWMAGRSVPRTAWQAMIVGLGGMGLVVSGAISTSLWQAVGAVAVLAAVALYAGSSVYAKEALESVHPFVSTAIQFFLGGIWLGIFSLIFERGRTSAWSTQAIIAVVFLSIFASALSFTLYYWLLHHIEAYELTSLQLIVPIIAVGEGAFFMRESVPWTMIAGAAVVLGSVVFVMRAKAADEKEIALDLSD
ncbi:MAG: EamA family transporter [Acidobacteriaceae bacterium]